MRHLLLTLPALFLLLLMGAAPPVPPPPIVAIGDLHGDLPATLTVMRLAGVVDGGGHWALGKGTFVQTGDITDRGAQSREVIELLARLEGEAAKAGGRVVALLGNHEVMNLQGDWRYVHPDEIAAFGGAEARKAAFAPAGVLGKWLRAHDPVALIDGTVYAHGGISAAFAAQGVSGLNQAARSAIAANTVGAPILGDAGPLWYRGYLQNDPALACPELTQALKALGARRMVVGHTTQASGQIAARCGGALLGIDTGISAHYGNHYAAVRLTSGDARAIYPANEADLPDPSPR